MGKYRWVGMQSSTLVYQTRLWISIRRFTKTCGTHAKKLTRGPICKTSKIPTPSDIILIFLLSS
jgi:hypothetical protein